MEIKKSLEDDYRDRHTAFKKLRHYWHGRYWDEVDSEAHGIASIFRDLTARQSDVGPDIKLVRNLLFEVSAKYQTFLSPLPMIRVYVDPPSSNTRRNQATLKERFLYGCWSENKATKLNADIAWYLPLMGSCFHGIFPDMDRKLPRMLLRSPENAYPVPSWDGQDDAYIFSWKIPQSAAMREWPDLELARKKRGVFKRGQNPDPTIEVMEWTDSNELSRWVDGHKTEGVEHNFGFNLFEHMKFINVPDEVWGHGAVEQAVNLVEMGNALYSLMFQAVMDNVFPQLVLIDPSKAPEEIEKGPGAVLPLNPGGDAKYLTPPVGAVGTHMAFLNENERGIKQATSMPDAMFGDPSNMGSIITGKAINELQGAGTGSLVEMVQGIGIGSGLVAWNEKAIHMARRFWEDDKMVFYANVPGTIADLNPRQIPLSLKGKELVGGARNEVVFSPHLSMHEKIVMGLQMAGAGLVSKTWQREQVGIPDSEAMEEEMVSEAINAAVLGAVVMALEGAGATPEAGIDAEDQALAYLQGQTSNFSPVTPNPQAPLPGAGGNELPLGPIAPGASGQVFSPAMQMPPGSPAPANMEQPAATGANPNAILLDEAIQAFQSVQNIGGRVFLVGEIVQTGQTDDDIEVALTNPADRQTLADGLPMFQGLLAFLHVEEEPSEQFIEVTPGAEPVQGGSEVDLEIEDEEEAVV